ncbi:hypothetical protein HG717_33695 [Rhodococcus erythropolis]|uniref:hypothetical protein n=1 Tax=Rhodococcus erythropolis TaxID=1833 RepID=UPI001C9AE286|nr:hypothetical protein [Rhodococcus erythropolis]MBY6388826.1 hypothetical protein [Rhodococcus erythropolis]
MTELSALLQRPKEALDPELAAYLVDSPLGPVIKHPLVFSIPHSPQLNAMANARLRAKQDGCRQALQSRKWSQYLFLHERPYRVNAFTRIAAQMAARTYWTSLAELWIDAENIAENEPLWTTLLQDSSRVGNRHLMMTAPERRHLAQQPALMRVYRGFNSDERQKGMSWSLDAEVARRFAMRFGHGRPRVAAGTVEKSAVIAYLSGRGEHEIVVVPAAVRDQHVTDAHRKQRSNKLGG